MKIDYATLHALFLDKLTTEGFEVEQARLLATIFTDNTRDGIVSHGINRFPRFISQIRDRIVDIEAEPVLISANGAMERWEGNHGPGPLNARFAMLRAMELADGHGLGMVALRNTTHWMRGGTYGYMAAEGGYAAVCWTNTTANMSPWGTTTHAIGNNPLVMAVPAEPHPVVIDMAMSQYSYGKLETMAAEGRTLDHPGGFDHEGRASSDPKEILVTKRVLPIGLWKGSGLSIMLDLFASMLSQGASTPDIPAEEHNCSQLFLAIAPDSKEEHRRWIESIGHTIERMRSICSANGEALAYPGLQTAARRKSALERGMELEEKMIQAVKDL